MKIYILPIFAILACLVSCNNQRDIRKKINPADKVLSAAEISVDNVKIPEVNQFGESFALNGAGCIFFHINPIGEIFLDKECLPGKQVIDVGCGFSDIPIKAIEKGISKYTATDISEDHLKILVKRTANTIDGDKLSNLKILSGKAQDVMSKLHGKYDAILADKVIHFFTPDEIERFIESSKSLLVAKGRIYVTVTSIYSSLGNNPLYKKQYLQRLREGKNFPGHFPDVMTKLEESEKITYSNKGPDEMVLFSRADLENLFKRHGMRVIFSCSLKQPEENSSKWTIFEGESYDDPSDFVGIIAEKDASSH